jgi:hypothetical protein
MNVIEPIIHEVEDIGWESRLAERIKMRSFWR